MPRRKIHLLCQLWTNRIIFPGLIEKSGSVPAPAPSPTNGADNSPENTGFSPGENYTGVMHVHGRQHIYRVFDWHKALRASLQCMCLNIFFYVWFHVDSDTVMFDSRYSLGGSLRMWMRPHTLCYLSIATLDYNTIWQVRINIPIINLTLTAPLQILTSTDVLKSKIIDFHAVRNPHTIDPYHRYSNGADPANQDIYLWWFQIEKKPSVLMTYTQNKISALYLIAVRSTRYWTYVWYAYRHTLIRWISYSQGI